MDEWYKTHPSRPENRIEPITWQDFKFEYERLMERQNRKENPESTKGGTK